MKNIPRIFIDEQLEPGKVYQLPKDVAHYLTRVMRTDKCLVFNNGLEYNANIVNYQLSIINLTEHTDPSNNLTLAFAPIKKTDDLINMATQMGVAKLLPVITERTVAHHINWDRMRKIATEAAEQSGRNSVPEILSLIKFSDLDKKNLVFADERFAHDNKSISAIIHHPSYLFIGPEGGFSDEEFAALDASGAIGISLGPTILRAEVAAIAAIAKVIL